jgi:hypothetical protein
LDVEIVTKDLVEEEHLTLQDAKTCAPGTTQLIRLKRMPNDLCPVRAIRWRLSDANAVTSLFGYYNPLSKKRKHLTRANTIGHLQKMWQRGGFTCISGHLFRVGGASFRFAMGISVEKIKELGRWTSESYQLYIRIYSSKEKKREIEIIQGANARENQK